VIDSGYIFLHRKLLKSPEWKLSTPEQRSVLIAILLMANYEANKWEWQGNEFDIKPGQFVTSLESLCKAAGKGVSQQNVRTTLKRFEKLGFLTNHSTKQGRLISIIKWDEYQVRLLSSNKETNKPLTNDQQTPNKPLTPIEERKKDKKDKKDKNNTRACAWPKDFCLTEEKISYAVQNGIAKNRVVDFFTDFEDWARSKGAVYKDWDAAFRTRVRKAQEYGRQFLTDGGKREETLEEWTKRVSQT